MTIERRNVEDALPSGAEASDIATRSLSIEDWPELWPMLGTADIEPKSSARARFETLLEDPRWGLLGATERSGRLVGYAAVQDYGPHIRLGDLHRVARFHDLFVLTDDRRRGAGRALMAAVVAWASTRVRHLEWQAHVERAAPFYTRLGFTGEPCPQPEYPSFEVDFGPPPGRVG